MDISLDDLKKSGIDLLNETIAQATADLSDLKPLIVGLVERSVVYGKLLAMGDPDAKKCLELIGLQSADIANIILQRESANLADKFDEAVNILAKFLGKLISAALS